MQRTTNPAGRWVSIDDWLTANREHRDGDSPIPAFQRLVEIEQRAQRAAARRRRPKRETAK